MFAIDTVECPLQVVKNHRDYFYLCYASIRLKRWRITLISSEICKINPDILAITIF